MSQHKTTVSHFQPVHATLLSYVTGFISCVALTVIAYLVATTDTVSNDVAIGLIAFLAVVQFVVQLVFFLHLGREFKPRWKLIVFWLMIIVVLVVVGGSIWIMQNLNYRMMHSQSEMNTYVQSQDSL